MNSQILAAEISVPGINIALVNLNTHFVIPGTPIFTKVNTHDTADNLIDSWALAIENFALANSIPIEKIALAMTGPCDYENGISLMTNQNKFEALYKLNVKELLAKRLNIEVEDIKMQNNTISLLMGEIFSGCAQGGYNNILAFTLNIGFGTARYLDGKCEDLKLWNVSFKDGIVENYLGVGWITKRYEEFTGIKVINIQELTNLTNNDDGIGQLVFNEYGENFVKFLIQQISLHNPQLIVIGGHNHAWNLFIPHVKDRVGEKDI